MMVAPNPEHSRSSVDIFVVEELGVSSGGYLYLPHFTRTGSCD